MKINREKALAAFQEYTDRYDSSRDMIRLKIEHTYRVVPADRQISGASGGRGGHCVADRTAP